MASLIVDIHPHIISHDTARYPVTPLSGKRSEWSEDHGVDAEQMIAAMAKAGVDKMAMVHSSTTYGFNSEYVADMVAKYSDKFTGVFSVDVLAADGPEKMRHWVSRGCTGMRIYTRGKTIKEALMTLEDSRIFGCYETAAELGISICVNPRVPQFHELRFILEKFPRTAFVLENLGSADFSEGAPFNAAKPLFELSKYRNLYLKVKSENNRKATQGKTTPEAMFGTLVSVFGADRMAWGSNYPSADGSLKELTDLARSTYASLKQSDQEWILGKTALKLYPALAK